MPDPVIVAHVCPRCRRRFDAPAALADTFCPACFGRAFGISVTLPRPWHGGLGPGIICLVGAFLVALWVFAHRG